MAEALELSKGKYEHYETRFKKPYLPADLAEKIANALAAKGIPTEDVMALAGPTAPDVPADTLNLAGRYSQLSPVRQRALRDLLEALEAAEVLGQATKKPELGERD